MLHEDDFVFGDLRELNILYSAKDGGRVFLVDFDSVGKHGESRYSSCLNIELGLGVDRGQIVEKSLDTVNLKRIMAWVSGEVASLYK